MTRTSFLLALLILTPVVSVASDADQPAAKFVKPPTAVKAGDKVKIEFAVDRETDLGVFLEDAKGRVVRHLVAGLLGKSPPAPLKANSLEQAIEWDGKADYGKPAPGGPYKVRVALGLTAKYDKVLMSDASTMGVNISGLVVGPDGTVYVLHVTGGTMSGSGAGGGKTLRAFGRDGSYLRTVLPFPANLPKEQIQPLGTIDVNGRPTPVNSMVFGGLYPHGGSTRRTAMAITPDSVILRVLSAGRLAAVDGKSGGIPWKSYQGGALPGLPGVRPCVVCSTDGKSALVGGLGKSTPVVYRVKLPERESAVVFFGDPAKAGAGESQLGASGATGLALDGKGHVLISDAANNRVLVVGEKDGKPVGSFAVQKPECIAVDPATGAVYVLADTGRSVLKFSGWKDAKELARLPITNPGGDRTSVMALDSGSQPPLVWVGTDGGRLIRAEDAGGKFTARDVSNPNLGQAAFLDMTIDRFRSDREIYARSGSGGTVYWRFNEETNVIERVQLKNSGAGFSGVNLVPAPDGKLYGLRWPMFFYQHDRKGAALHWEQPDHPARKATDGFGGKWTREQSYIPVAMGAQPHTLGVRGTDGHLFAMVGGEPGGRPARMMREYLPNGKLVSEDPVVWKVSDAAVGPRFDAAGNIYIADVVRPLGWVYPPEFDKVIPNKIEMNKTRVSGAQDAIAYSYGSIIKFSPKGGIIDYKPVAGVSGVMGVPYKGEPKLDPSRKSMDVAWYGAARFHGPVKLVGAEWIHPGISQIGLFYCNCENVNFDVDEFGRVFFPDTDLFQVRVIDTAGNALLKFGSYGNADSCGPDRKDKTLAVPGIAFARRTGVVVTDRYAYCGDSMNRRLLRAKLVYTTDKTCDVK